MYKRQAVVACALDGQFLVQFGRSFVLYRRASAIAPHFFFVRSYFLGENINHVTRTHTEAPCVAKELDVRLLLYLGCAK